MRKFRQGIDHTVRERRWYGALQQVREPMKLAGLGEAAAPQLIKPVSVPTLPPRAWPAAAMHPRHGRHSLRCRSVMGQPIGLYGRAGRRWQAHTRRYSSLIISHRGTAAVLLILTGGDEVNPCSRCHRLRAQLFAFRGKGTQQGGRQGRANGFVYTSRRRGVWQVKKVHC